MIHRLAAEFRVVAFDNRGMGESDKPRGCYDFDLLAHDLAFVLESLEATAVTPRRLVDRVLHCAARYLERGGERAARLAVAAGPIRLESCEGSRGDCHPGKLEAYLDDLVSNWPRAELDFARGARRGCRGPVRRL